MLINPKLVRLIFFILAIVTNGAFFALYFILFGILPEGKEEV
ncbi:PspC domain-containing protein [Alloiococcus otitis]